MVKNVRLIDADALITEYYKNPTYPNLCKAINYAPTIDAEPVVRCKGCKHFKRDIPCVGGTYNGCDRLEGRDGNEPYVEEDFFCAYGERKDDE